jgi:beta-glucanase (GH16 family)
MKLAPTYGWLRLVLSVAAAGLLAASSAHAQTWNLVWSDEFNGSSVNTANWTFETGGGGWGNQELENYTSGANASVANGILTITARKTTTGSCWYGTCQYTSTRMKTQGKREIRYGRIEARMQLPAGKGLWPAFWMLGSNIGSAGWPQCGELDIMENRGSSPGSSSSAIHGPGYSGATPFNHGTGISSGGWNTYAIEWSATQLRFLVNGTVHYTVSKSTIQTRGAWVFDQPFFIIMNLAVGGHFDGSPTSSTPFPANMNIDYVRVYQAGSGTPTPTPGGGVEITPGAGGVSASSSDANVPANAVDNNVSTRWSASGDGQWLRLDLGSVRAVSHVRVAAYQGNLRRNRFDIQVSSDNATWTTVLAGAETSGTSTAEQTFDFANVNARYVRYVGHGATLNAGGTSAWNSVSEISVFAP